MFSKGFVRVVVDTCPSTTTTEESEFFGTLTTSDTTEPPWHIQEHRETPSCQACFPLCSQLALRQVPTWRHTYTHILTTPRPPLRSVVAPTRPHFPFWVQPKPFRKAYNVLNLAASAPQHAPTACWVMSSRSLHSPPTRKGARPEYQKRAGKFDPRS